MVMPLVNDLPPDLKASRPRTKGEAIELINDTFCHNGWDETLQIIYLSELQLKPEWKKLEQMELDEILKEWRTFDNTLLKRILIDMEKHRMILFK